jgi:hypothetical protein
MVVDGIDNKEDHCGGIEIVYSLEGIQEFKLLATGPNAEYGRGTANAIVATKSGGNELHGSGFIYYRNQDLVKTDFLSLPANGGLGKAPFSREQSLQEVGGEVLRTLPQHRLALLVECYTLAGDACGERSHSCGLGVDGLGGGGLRCC